MIVKYRVYNSLQWYNDKSMKTNLWMELVDKKQQLLSMDWEQALWVPFVVVPSSGRDLQEHPGGDCKVE